MLGKIKELSDFSDGREARIGHLSSSYSMNIFSGQKIPRKQFSRRILIEKLDFFVIIFSLVAIYDMCPFVINLIKKKKKKSVV